METAIKEAIKELAYRSKSDASTAPMALNYSQAALNLAHVLQTLKHTELAQ